jgi:type II secretory pathway pseudopilin PulG
MASRIRISSARSKAGFTYVGLLIAIVFFGLGSVGAARVLASSERGEREAELLFVGNQFRQAIGTYYVSSPGAPRYPEKLEDLLLDPRFPAIKRHLRKMHVDPITAKAEWGLIKAPEGGIMGVHSLSEREPLKRANFDIADQSFEVAAKSTLDRPYIYREWQFVFRPASGTPIPSAARQ